MNDDLAKHQYILFASSNRQKKNENDHLTNTFKWSPIKLKFLKYDIYNI